MARNLRRQSSPKGDKHIPSRGYQPESRKQEDLIPPKVRQQGATLPSAVKYRSTVILPKRQERSTQDGHGDDAVSGNVRTHVGRRLESRGRHHHQHIVLDTVWCPVPLPWPTNHVAAYRRGPAVPCHSRVAAETGIVPPSDQPSRWLCFWDILTFLDVGGNTHVCRRCLNCRPSGCDACGPV
jgi:hypothetical protein